MEDGHFNLAFEESVPQGGGTSDFNALINRPKYNGALMTSNTNIPAVPTKTSDLTNDSDFVKQAALDVLEQELQDEIAEKQDRLTAGANITIVDNVISATGSGTGDYDYLENKPSIEGITLEGNKTAAQLGLATATALAAEIGAREGADEVIEGNIETLSTAVSEHDTSIQNLENDVDALQTDVETLEGEVSSIEDVIPAQASISNQLADKAFVNSTVQTGTANFRGNWMNWAAVPVDPTEYPADYTGTTTPSTNDYMVVQDASGYVDPTETLAGTWRFKYTGVWATDDRNGWQPEYQVNETPLTAAQLAALNSGATSALIEQITRNEDAISALDADKQDLLEPGENIKTLNNTSLLGSGNITTNKVVEIGNGQYTYQGYVLPTISVTIARQVYTDDQAGISQVLHWSIYGTDNNLKVVSSDHIGTEYSIDVLVHNKYHCAYIWTDQTTGDINPTVETSQHITIAQTTGQSTEAVMSQKAVTDAIAGGGGGGTWGSITGTLSNQTDLQNALDDKQNLTTVANHTLYL